MPVIDADGRLIGSVKYVRAGDPDTPADTQHATDDGLGTAFARALPDVEPQVGVRFAERLVRRGFLKVAGAGLMDHDCYVAADQIARADEDQVHLSATANELVTERQRWV